MPMASEVPSQLGLSPPHSPTALTPPTSLSPGARATALQKVFNDALAHTLRTCSYSNFSACFPTPAKYVPEALDGLHRDFVSKLEEVCKKEFASLMEERVVVTSLNELDDLVADARRRKERSTAASESTAAQNETVLNHAPPTPPHLLPPSSLIAAHLAPFLSAQSQILNATLEETQRSNKALADDIASQRMQIEELVAGLEGMVEDLEGAAAAFDGEEMEGVEKDLAQSADLLTAR